MVEFYPILAGAAAATGGAGEVGNKAWNLMVMARAGLPVPPAFVLPTTWCRRAQPAHEAMLRQILSEGIAQLETTTGLAFGLDPTLSGMEMIKAWKQKLGSYKPLKPVEVAHGPVTENVESGDKVDILKFPTPRWHEHDGGRYIGTGCLVIMEDPDEKWTNVGTYRVCVHNRDTLGIWISPGKHGRLIREKYWSNGKGCCGHQLWSRSCPNEGR